MSKSADVPLPAMRLPELSTRALISMCGLPVIGVGAVEPLDWNDNGVALISRTCVAAAYASVPVLLNVIKGKFGTMPISVRSAGFPKSPRPTAAGWKPSTWNAYWT